MKKALIGIIGGKGKMGAYFADFFARNGHEVIVSDIGTPMTNKQLAQKADVVIVSVPIDQAEKVILEVAPLVKKSGLLMDLTSVKMSPMECLKKTKASYIGCHPLFGPTAGIHGQTFIVCPGSGKLWEFWLKRILESNGVIVRELSAKKHDEFMSYIQTLTHFSHIAFADALRKSGIPIKEFIKYPSPVYMLELYLMGRILNQDPKLYANIQIENPLNVKAVESYLKSCRQLAETIERKKFRENVDFFKKNSEYLGHFGKIAMDESDRLLRHLKLPQKSSLFRSELKPASTDIAILGPQNTYSDLALRKFDKKANPWYALSIPEVFELVAGKKVQAGLVPIENSSSGSIRETLDELYDTDVHIEQLIGLPVTLSVASTIDFPLKKITTVYTHSQALLQCREFLKKYCSGATLVPMSSTSAALERMINEDKEGTVAIASPEAAEAYHLKILKGSIEDNKDNTTYFALIKKGSLPQHPRIDAKRTSIAFHFKEDSPGSLNSILQTLAEGKINLSKIESRPNGKVRGEYVFHVDFEGRYDALRIQAILKSIKAKVAKLKILGSY